MRYLTSKIVEVPYRRKGKDQDEPPDKPVGRVVGTVEEHESILARDGLSAAVKGLMNRF
jgi:hypothetical protein